MEKQILVQIMVSFATATIIGLFLKLYAALVAAPRRLRRLLNQQGIQGPPPANFLLGNILEIQKSMAAAPPSAAAAGPPSSHDCGSLVFPVFDKWRRQYGDVYTFALGNKQIILVNDHEVAKEVIMSLSRDLGKPSYLAKDLEPLLGKGIVTSNGELWAYQKKVIAPELFVHKVKGMTSLIEESASILIDSWKGVIDDKGGKAADIKIDDYLRKFSGDVISRACFGSSYAESEQFFQKLKALQKVSASKGMAVGIPGMSYVPTKQNRMAWGVQRDVRDLIFKLIKQKSDESRIEKNLLQMILEGAKNSNMSPAAVEKFTIDNCKNIYLAGYETTAITATWCLMLLASYPEWQDRAREEVIGICKGKLPDSDSIRHMKQLTMVINETLRLYPPVTVMAREALNEIEFSNIYVPKGVTTWILVTALHTDPGIWGPDSYEFNPERFADGTTGACKLPTLYIPFGGGPRMCLGMNLAMVELKILVSLLLTNFSFTLSPKYVHDPVMNLVLEPRNKVNLLIEKLNLPFAAA